MDSEEVQRKRKWDAEAVRKLREKADNGEIRV